MTRTRVTRRAFLRTSAGLLAVSRGPDCWTVASDASEERRFGFRAYRRCETLGPVTCVTPDDGFYVHTYYDVCPFSPSQRFLAATRIPFQDRTPRLGDTADVCVIDLVDRTIRSVYATKCWGFQTGANLHWGATDRRLYTNDVVDGRAVCVRLDLPTGQVTAFAGPAYDVAPDESCAIGFPLELMDASQPGYGVPAKDPKTPARLPPGAAKDEGLWKTDLTTNTKTLLVSLADLAQRVPEPPPKQGGTYYLWHAKFNRQGTRIMQVFRCLFPDGWGGRNAMVFTLKPDGSDIHLTPSIPLWGHKGGHPNWHPDGKHLIRNLRPNGKKDRLCKLPCDGSGFTVLSETIDGGGHPTIESAERYIVTDAYPKQTGTTVVRIRLIDLVDEKDLTVCVMPTVRQVGGDTVMRVDGHPAWSRDFKKVIFQGTPDGRRQLFVADLSRVV